jgi:hypothetical protein
MRSPVAFVIALALVLAACASSSQTPSPQPGGPVAGAPDSHCGARVRLTSAYACVGAVQGQSGSSAGGAEAPVMFGTSGADDDCKYDVSWSLADVRRDVDVTFSRVAHARGLGTAVVGAAPRAELYLNDQHPGPNTLQTPVEEAPGAYRIGPVRFDAPGRWTVRFHLFEQCAETSPDSPHGHAAFYLDVT